MADPAKIQKAYTTILQHVIETGGRDGGRS